MDKTLLKAYIRTIVEEEVKRILPELLSEAVQEVKQITESAQPSAAPKKRPAIDKGRLAQLMGIEYDRNEGTIRANTSGIRPNTITAKDAAGNVVELPANAVKSEVVDAINRDYSQLMKAMKLT